MVAGLPNVLMRAYLRHRQVLQSLVPLVSPPGKRSTLLDLVSSTRSTLRVFGDRPVVPEVGHLSGWSERIDDTETMQPPRREGGVSLRPPLFTFHPFRYDTNRRHCPANYGCVLVTVAWPRCVSRHRVPLVVR